MNFHLHKKIDFTTRLFNYFYGPPSRCYVVFRFLKIICGVILTKLAWYGVKKYRAKTNFAINSKLNYLNSEIFVLVKHKNRNRNIRSQYYSTRHNIRIYSQIVLPLKPAIISQKLNLYCTPKNVYKDNDNIFCCCFLRAGFRGGKPWGNKELEAPNHFLNKLNIFFSFESFNNLLHEKSNKIQIKIKLRYAANELNLTSYFRQHFIDDFAEIQLPK